MPEFKTVTKQAQEVWKSPDGQRVLYEVILDYQGNELKAKTYSKAIAEVGWTGEVRTEEQPSKKGGVETFVTQPPKEGGFSGGGGKSYTPKDEGAIQAMWAITKAIEWLSNSEKVEIEDLGTLESLAKDFNAMVDRVKGGTTPTKEPETLSLNLDEIFPEHEDKHKA